MSPSASTTAPHARRQPLLHHPLLRYLTPLISTTLSPFRPTVTNGFLRVAAAVPRVNVASVAENTESIIALADELNAKGVELAVMPEMCVTAYSCADLFHSSTLIAAAADGLRRIAEASSRWTMTLAVGVPVSYGTQLPQLRGHCGRRRREAIGWPRSFCRPTTNFTSADGGLPARRISSAYLNVEAPWWAWRYARSSGLLSPVGSSSHGRGPRHSQSLGLRRSDRQIRLSAGLVAQQSASMLSASTPTPRQAMANRRPTSYIRARP